MPTEAFRIADSQSIADNGGYVGARVAHNFTGAQANPIIASVHEVLIEAGWQPAGGTTATFSLALPFGLPVTEPPSPPLTSLPIITRGPSPISVEGSQIMFYDPYRETPAIVAGVHWIVTGTTLGISIDNLADAIEALGGWIYRGNHTDTVAPFTGWLHMDFEAPAVGAEWNGTQFGGPKQVVAGATTIWYWGFLGAVGLPGAQGNAPAGGGYILHSEQGFAAWVEVWLGIPATGSAEATFRFITPGTTGGEAIHILPVTIGADDEYRILANQFQFFAYLDKAPDSSADRARQLACIFPKLATDRGVDYAAVTAGAGTFRELLQWAAAGAVNDSGFTRRIGTYDYAGLAPGFYLLRFAGVEIRDARGHPIAQTAFLGAPPNGAPNNAAGQARIVGVAWDAILVSALADLGDRVVFRGLRWECVGRQEAGPTGALAPATLWIAYELATE